MDAVCRRFSNRWKVSLNIAFGEALRCISRLSITRSDPFAWGVLFALSLLSVPNKTDALSIVNGTAVVENFDSMAATTTLPNSWRIHQSSTPSWASASTTVGQQASSGTPATGASYNWGSTSSERAPGVMTSGGYASPSSLMGVYTNNSGSAITQLAVSYSCERYRVNTAAASVQFYYSTDGSTWTAATAGDVAASSLPTGTSAYSFNPPNLTVNVSSFNITALNIANNGVFYLRWNLNTTGSNSQGIGIDNVSVTATFGTPSIALGDNGTQVASANVVAGSTSVILHKSQMAVTVANATLTGISFTSAGAYAASDLSNFKVWYNTSSSFSGASQLDGTITTGLGAGSHNVSGLSQAINSGNTGYIFITADIAASPTPGNTINVSALNTADFTFSSGTKSGSTTAGGAQTILTLPALTSPTATAIGQTAATLGANVTSLGGVGSLSSRGTVFNTTGSPVTENALAEGGTGSGVFSHSRALSQGTKYYYRGYAVNTAGTAYSPQGSFYTEPGQASSLAFSSVAGTSMTVSWSAGANSDGSIVIVRDGNAAVSDPVDGALHTGNSTLGSGADLGSGSYVVYRGSGASVALTGLTAGHTYYVEVFAYKGTAADSGVDQGVNYRQAGPATGNQATLSTSVPALSSPTASSISVGGATLGATIDSDGNSTITARGTVWGTSAAPTGNALAEGDTAVGAFSHARTGMSAGTLIYYRGYAVNGVGTGYSSDGTFWTVSDAPAVSAASSITSSGFNANWSAATGATNYLLDVATDSGFTAIVSGYNGKAVGAVTTYGVSGLNSFAPYYYRLRAQNSGGISTNSSIISMTTLANPPTVSTVIASTTNATSAIAGGNVTADGNAAVTNRGVVWASTPSPIVPGAQSTNGVGTGIFSATLENLSPGSIYYYRAFAQNTAGTSYGTEYSLTARCFGGEVSGLMASVTNGTDFTASWSALDGAAGYALDVSTVSNFAVAASGTIYTNTWEGASKGSYASGTVAVAGQTWWLNDALIGTSANDRKNGLNSARVQNTGTLGMQTSTNMGLSSITLLYAVYGTDGSSAGRVEYTTDGWATWSTAGTFTASSASLTAFEATNLNASGSVAVRVIKSSGGASRYSIDDIRLYPFGGADGFVSGYQNREVVGASQVVTGLTAGSTYYFRVRATNENCVSVNSSTASVTTVITDAPDLALLATNGTVIAAGSVTPSLLAGTDFGAVSVAAGSVSRTFTITNSGQLALSVTGVTTSGPNAADFRVTAPPAGAVAAGAQTTFTIEFDPSGIGARTGVFAIANNVSGKNPYTFAVRGDGVITLGEAVEQPDLNWISSGSNSIAWFGQTNTTHDGLDAAQSGRIGHNASTWLYADVVGPGTVTFWWKVSSETNYDTLDFFVGDTYMTSISGESGWLQYTAAVPAGVNDLYWQYVKDGSATGGQDAAWVDQVVYTPGAPVYDFSLNGGDTNISDAQLAAAVTVRVSIADADGINWNGSVISPQPDISPYLCITNPSGSQILSPVSFDSSGHTDGELFTTITGVVSVSSVSTGSPFIANIVYADNAGNVVTSIFPFTVYDDDTEPPQILDVSVRGIKGWTAGTGGLTTNFSTSFENADVWTDQTGGNWTNAASNGSWISSGCYANNSSPRTGTRILGMNDNGDYIQLPPLTNPASLSVWARCSGSGVSALRLDIKDGASWTSGSTQSINSTTYNLFNWTLGVTGVVTVRLYAVDASPSMYLDDLQALGGTVEVWPKSALSPGDLFITGFNADGFSDFSFLTFVDIVGSTQIRFTDYGWTNGNFTTAGEGVITYTAPAGGLSAGSVVLLTNYAAGSGYGVSAGSATKSGSFNFSGSGDQLLVYQVTLGMTSFVFALSTDSTNWNAASAAANYSELPPGLTTGVSAVHTRQHLGSLANIDCGVAAKVAGAPEQVRAQLFSATNWLFTEDGPYVLSPAPHTGGIVYDGMLTNAGYGVTSVVYDAISGLIRDGADGARYSIVGADGGTVVNGAALITGLASNGAARTATAISASGNALSPAAISLGAYTALVYVADFDQDRAGDSLSATGRVWFTVLDDDTNPPAINGFRLSGNSTNFDTGSGGNLVLTGLLTDVESPVFSGGYAYFLVRDPDGGVLASNTLYAGAGNATTGTCTAPLLNCGQDYTVVVVAADSDLDRGALDQSVGVATTLVFRTTGIGGPSDYPTASNLLVNGVAAAPATTISDATIHTGGWSLAFSLSHPVGVFTNANSPSFRVTNVLGAVLSTTPWSNGVKSGQTYFFTNSNLPGVSYASVATGLYYVVWSASNQGSCVASIVDRDVIAGGVNVFTVTDDDETPPVLSGFAVAGGGSVISVDQATSGFGVTGLVQDAGSGVAFASAPPYALLYNLSGGVLASNSFTGGVDGAGKTSAAPVTNWFSGLTLTCGNSYTMRVFAADADDDRPNDRAAITGVVLVVQTSGEGGEAPGAKNLLVNGVGAGVATITDHDISRGTWTAALTIAHSSELIVTNGPGAPSFSVQNATGGSLYVAASLNWSQISKSGLNYYATNKVWPSSDTNRINLGLYSLVWSAQSEGLCYGSIAGSGAVSPGTNRFTVVDDDTLPPNLFGLSVAGGTGTGGGDTYDCPDPAATNLHAGDIAIFALNTKTRGTTNNDSFAFVTLVDIPSGTRIKFTDNGWSSSKGAFRNSEGTLTWMATNCLPIGTVVRWIATNAPTVNHGLIIATNGNFAPNIEGEQILAYQGPDSAPNFIYAINDRLGGVWDADAVDSHSSAIPPGLMDGYTAVAVGEFDNVIISTNNLAIAGDRELILYYIGGRENWIGEDENVYDLLAFNFTFPDANASGGAITDHNIGWGGWSITGLVQDVGSGVAVSNGAGLRYEIFSTNGAVVVGNYFGTTFANGSRLLHGFSNSIPGGLYSAIGLGVYTARVSVADTDDDRFDDAAERVTNVAFTVTDDDVDIPQIGYFSINGQTFITNVAELTSVVISGQVRDVTSGIAFQSAPPTFEVLNSLGSVAASGGFDYAPASDGAALAWTPIRTTTMNLAGIADCGTYTVRVTVADADDDRPGDRLTASLFFLINVASGNGDAPTASNLLVNATPASIATLTDAELAAGGWSLEVTMHHPSGIMLDPPNTPSFEVLDPVGAVIIADDWTNIETQGTTAFATNSGLPAIPYNDVHTGFHSVVWSARSQGGCYGFVSESPLIYDTNRFLVVDDDTVGPTAPTNVVSTASYWTNKPVIAILWDTTSVYDASGVLEYRFSTNSVAPSTVNDGFSLGLNSSLALTNTEEGIHTNWLYAVDADNDRPNDSAMGVATSVVFQLDFTAPTQVVGFAAAPGAVDDTSQIDLSWTPLPDAGNPDLSPWNTYRVYYTQDGGTPTTNDSFVDLASYADLATNTTSSVVLEGLVMGAEYHLAIAGLDRAGNQGPLSDPVSVTLGQIIITQAFANAQSQTEISWVGTGSAFYDVIYSDETGYTSRVDSRWKLAQTVSGTHFVDAGGVNDGDGSTRLPPMELSEGMMRFYRVSAVNSWIPSSGRAGGATTQIVVALKSVLSNGYNFVGMGMTPMVNTLSDFLGTNRLPAGNSMSTSTVISVYEPSPTGDPQPNAWWLSTAGGWRYEDGGGLANTQALPYPFTGYNVLIPTNVLKTNLLLVGRVPWTNYPGFNLYPNTYHVISLNTPRPTKLSELGMRSHLVWGSQIIRADEIRVLQRGIGPWGSPRARMYVNTNGVFTYHTGGTGSAENFIIRPDDAIIVYTRKLASPVVWTPPVQFEFPKVQITNAINAAPSVLAMQPLEVTFTSAVLRGLVNPNGLSSVAHIAYGTTTNYGNVIAVTNLAATNMGLQISGEVSGLATGTLYHFRVVASNSAGSSRFGAGSFYTLGVCTGSVPGSTSVAASDGASTAQIALTWSDAGEGAGYAVYRNTANDSAGAAWIGSTAAGALSYSDATASPGQLYYYWIKATNCAGVGIFGASDTGYRKLATVIGLSASYNQFTNRVRVSWSDVSGESGYGIWRHTSDNNASVSFLAGVGAGVTNYDDTSAAADTDYYYWVRATNTSSATQGDAQSAGALGRRNSVGVPVLSTPLATSISSTGATLGATILDDGGAAITARGTVWGGSPTPAGNSLSEGGIGISAFSHARVGLPVGTLLYFRGWASNSAGMGYSPESSFWTVPSAPGDLVVTGVSTNGFVAGWSAATGATNYLLDVSGSPSFSSYSAGYSNFPLGPVTSYSIAGLPSASTLYWRVRAQNSGGIGADSSTTNASTLAGAPTLQVSGLTFSSVGFTNLVLNWTNGNGTGRLVLGRKDAAITSLPAGGVNYLATNIYGAGSVLGADHYALYKGTGGSVSIVGLQTNSAYFFRVFEFNGSGSAINYLTSPAAGNPGGQATLPLGCAALSIYPIVLGNGTNGNFFTTTLTASNGVPAYTFAHTAGTLPPNLTLMGNGSLAGTLISAGTNSFTVTVTDANGCVGIRNYSFITY